MAASGSARTAEASAGSRTENLRSTRRQTASSATTFRALWPIERDGSIWIGTEAGLSRFQHGRFVNYTAKDGLAGRCEVCYRDTDGSLWIGTIQGVHLQIGRRPLAGAAVRRACAARRSMVDGARSRERHVAGHARRAVQDQERAMRRDTPPTTAWRRIAHAIDHARQQTACCGSAPRAASPPTTRASSRRTSLAPAPDRCSTSAR